MMTIKPGKRALWVALLLGATMIADAGAGRWAGWSPDAAVVQDGAVGGKTGPDDESSDLFRADEDGAAIDVVTVSGRPSEDYLVDAGELLSPTAAGEWLEFLRYHADDSMIDLYVYVVDAEWQMQEQDEFGGFFEKKDAAVVVYPLADPQRAAMYLPAHLAGRVAEAEQRRALQSSVTQASARADVEDQLDAFLVQMSIRLYWMERMLAETLPAVEKRVSPPPVAEDPIAQDVRMPVPDKWLPWMAVGGFATVVLPTAWWWRRRNASYHFPEIVVEPRLGGRHAAGVGAVISYLSAKVPPARQRAQAPENPRFF